MYYAVHNISQFLSYFNILGDVMQQLAYSGYQAPQQIPQITMEPTTFFADSVIPMIPGWEHSQWMVVRDDFRVVAGEQTGAPEVLRFFERMTNRRKAKLRKQHGIPEEYLPHDDDLRLSASFDDIYEGAMCLWSYVTCWRAVYYLIGLGFLEQSFIARKTAAVVGQPKTVIYEDDKGFFIAVDDKDGNYTDINGEEHNAADEGYIIEWQYLLCFDAIRAALAKAAWQDPPEPAKRWPPVVKRREPTAHKKGNDATTSTDCDPSNASSVSHQPNPSHPSAQGGTLNAEVCEEESGPFYNTVDTNVLSTIRGKICTNIPITSTNSNVVEDSCKAPWSAETLVDLARSRHTPGLFECAGTDEDYTGAEKLDRHRLSLRLDPRAFWPLVDQHIMAMMYGETWYATKRKGNIKRFTLAHVASQWYTVEDELKKHPYYPPDPVRYFGPPEDEGKPRDHSWIFGNVSEPVSNEEMTPDIVEGSLEMENPEPVEETQGSEASPGETEENTMHILPPPSTQTMPSKRGMTANECDDLMDIIEARYPEIILKFDTLTDGSFCVKAQVADNRWSPAITNAAMWYGLPPAMKDAVEKAVRYGEAVRCSNQ